MSFCLNTTKLVMFDLDGTLIDTLPDIAHALDQAFVSLGFSAPGLSNARLWVGNGSLKLILRALSSACKLPEKQLDEQLIEQVQQRFFNYYAQCCDVDSSMYAGVQATLDFLKAKHIKLACITNKPARFSKQVLAGSAIEHFFELIISGDTLPKRKPDPLPLQHTMQFFGCSNKESLMVGDSYNDIYAARAAAVPIICVDYGYNYGEPIPKPSTQPSAKHTNSPDVLVASLAEFFIG